MDRDIRTASGVESLASEGVLPASALGPFGALIGGEASLVVGSSCFVLDASAACYASAALRYALRAGIVKVFVRLL